MLSEPSSEVNEGPSLDSDIYILPHSVPPPHSAHFSDSDSTDNRDNSNTVLKKNASADSNINVISNTQVLRSPEPLQPVANYFKTPSTSRAYLDSILNSDSNYVDSVASMHTEQSSAESTDESSTQVEEEISVAKSGGTKRKKSKKAEQKKIKKCVKPNPCLNKKCGNDCGVKLTEEERLAIHEYYWGISDKKMRKKWLVSCVKPKNIRRKRTTSNFRQISYDYIINYQGKDVKVCQQFLLKTLDISQMTLRYAVLKSGVLNVSKDDKEIVAPNNKPEEAEIAALKAFIENLPKSSFLKKEELLSQLKQKIISSSKILQHTYLQSCLSAGTSVPVHSNNVTVNSESVPVEK